MTRGVTASAAERAQGMLGYPVSDEAWQAAIASIVSRKALLLRRSGDDLEHWLIKLDGIEVAAVWAVSQGSVIAVRSPSEKLPMAAKPFMPPTRDNRHRTASRSGRGGRYV